MSKAKCVSCGIIKTLFVKEKKEENLISIKQCFFYYQKNELTLPGNKYCGPGNPPTNELDAICMEHDYCYSSIAVTFLKANAIKIC